jgi:nucleoside permease NupC
MLFHTLKAKQCAILVIHRVHDDTLALKDVFISSIDNGTIFLASCGSSAIIKISCYVCYMFLIEHCLAGLKMDLPAGFIVGCVLEIPSFEIGRLCKT